MLTPTEKERIAAEFDTMISGRLGGYGDQILYREEDIKTFLFSTIDSLLEEKAGEIEKFAKFITDGGPEGEYYLLPPNAKNVVGYISDPVIGHIAYKGKPMNVRAVIEEAIIKSAAILKGSDNQIEK